MLFSSGRRPSLVYRELTAGPMAISFSFSMMTQPLPLSQEAILARATESGGFTTDSTLCWGVAGAYLVASLHLGFSSSKMPWSQFRVNLRAGAGLSWCGGVFPLSGVECSQSGVRRPFLGLILSLDLEALWCLLLVLLDLDAVLLEHDSFFDVSPAYAPTRHPSWHPSPDPTDFYSGDLTPEPLSFWMSWPAIPCSLYLYRPYGAVSVPEEEVTSSGRI